MFRQLHRFAFLLAILVITSEARIVHSQQVRNTAPFLQENILPVLPLAPPMDFPDITVTKSNYPAPGNFFLTDFSYVQTGFGSFIMILDSTSKVLFLRRNSSLIGAMDFRPQPNGLFTFFDEKAQVYLGLDPTSNTIVDTFKVKDLHWNDHELQCFKDGSYVLLGDHTDTVDMSKIIPLGLSKALVTFQVIQEFNKEKQLIFSWDSKDHYPITGAKYEGLTGGSIDATHINSIERDTDGNFIISVRSQSEITKINAIDHSVMWRWGGDSDQFTHTDLDSFSYQHDVRRLPNGHITMFDNGNHDTLLIPISRAVEYEIDEKAKTSKKVWEFRHSPDIFTEAMGSVQRLANGNTLIGWGLADSTIFTEVTPEDSVALEMTWGQNLFNYRVYKYTDEEIALMSAVAPAGKQRGITLEQNYPNPFSSYTIINFTISTYTPVTLKVYDALGREVKTLFDGTVNPGNYSSKFEVDNIPNGMYNCVLATPSVSQSCRIIVSK